MTRHVRPAINEPSEGDLSSGQLASAVIDGLHRRRRGLPPTWFHRAIDELVRLRLEVTKLRDRLAAAGAEIEEAEAGVAAALGITERTYRDCTCTGSCEGRDTLAPDYHCQLDRRER